MRIYLDLCCFNRPYDDQLQTRIRIETEAKLLLQQKVVYDECQLLWSSILDFECFQNPYEEHRIAILQWRHLACEIIMADTQVVLLALKFVKGGVGEFDALHAASSVLGRADVFITTDDRLLKKLAVLWPCCHKML
jgi:hypothetical protein